MAACTQGIGSACAKREARSSQSNSSKSASLVYCAATLEVRLTFRAVEKFRYKNLHFVLSFFFVSHNSSTNARKNTKNHYNSLFYTRMCLLILRRQATSLATAANYASDKRSIHDAIFIQQLTTLMTAQKYTIGISQLSLRSLCLFSNIQRATCLLTTAKTAVFSRPLCQSIRAYAL